ncbi:MAG: ferrous iron transporter B [Synergistaceae bacterium]
MGCHDCNNCKKSCFSKTGLYNANTNKATSKILLMGNPNVGKSVFFSRLTGVHALSSNYPGTTVGFTEGILSFNNELAKLIDVPGAYTLDPTNEAEEIAHRIINDGADKVILVIDATALERNLVMALQVLEHKIPTIIALNMVDEARHRGILVDIEKLQEELGVPVIPTVAVTGQGLSDLINNLDEATISHFSPMSKEERWCVIGNIVNNVQRVTHRHHTLMDIIEDLSAHTFTGIIIGLVILTFSFTLIRFMGEGIINYITDPLFKSFWEPFLMKLHAYLGNSYWSELLIGHLFDGKIDMEQSLGVLSTGLYVEFSMVLPYIVSFYAVLSFLEDFGYLPRLAVVFDALLHRFGIHGYAIIPTLLGFGCNVPGILGTRVLESDREKFIAITLIAIGVPCVSMQAMLTATLGEFGMRYIVFVYIILFLVWMILGRLMHLTLNGFSPELIVEIPPYRFPSFRALLNKLWFRIKGFLYEATPLVLGGILIVNILQRIGFMDSVANIFAPLFKNVLGLPPETAVPIVMGLFRKDIAMGLLIPLNLNASQTLVAVVLLAMTFPCIATFIVMWKELGTKRFILSTTIILSSAVLTGALLNMILKVFPL